MLGKRSRQIQRTTSMLQLGHPLLPAAQESLHLHGPPSASATVPQLRHPHPIRFSPKIAAPVDGSHDPQIQLQTAECVVSGTSAGVDLETDMQNPLQFPEGLPRIQESFDQKCSMHGTQKKEISHFCPESGLWVPSASSVSRFSLHAKEAAESIPPVDFLEFCSFCRRRLVHDRDIFIYRGDSAFCSEECRNQLISRDERRATSSSEKGTTRRNGKVSETAVAA